MKKRPLINLRLLWSGLILTSLVLTACGDTAATAITPTIAGPTAKVNTSQPPVKMAVGSTVPDFTAKDINGQSLKLSSFRGKTVLVNFWAVY